MTIWCLTTSPDNIARTAELGWKVQGIKSRRGKTAREIAPGDRLVYYVTKHIAFGAIVRVTSPVFEDHEPVWESNPGEDYPWRFEITPEVVVENPERWVPVADLYERLVYPRKWPREHYTLAFQGNIRAWPEPDYEVVRAALEDAAAPESGR